MDAGRDLPTDDDAENLSFRWPGSRSRGLHDGTQQGEVIGVDESPSTAEEGSSAEPAPTSAVGPSASADRMESLQEALLAIRSRVEALNSSPASDVGSSIREAPAPPPLHGAVDLQSYHQAQEQRTLAEVRRHALVTEESLRRMGGVIQDLSLDLRSIVDAARRAIDQTSDQAESGVELARLLGRRIDQLDEDLGHRLGRLETREPDKGLGELRQELVSLRRDIVTGSSAAAQRELKEEIATLRQDLAAGVGAAAQEELGERLDTLSQHLTDTLDSLAELVEGAPAQDEAAVEDMLSTIKAETEATVEPFRVEVEDLGRRLSKAVDREEQLGRTLAILTDEVQRLRRRLSVRATSPAALDEEQVESIARAVIAALSDAAVEPAAEWEPSEAEWEPGEEGRHGWEEEPEAAREEPRPAPERPLRAHRQSREARPVIRARQAGKRKKT